MFLDSNIKFIKIVEEYLFFKGSFFSLLFLFLCVLVGECVPCVCVCVCFLLKPEEGIVSPEAGVIGDCMPPQIPWC